MAELGGQLTVRYKHESDHSMVAPVIAASQAYFMLASHSRRRERYLVDARRVDKPKIDQAWAILTHCSKKAEAESQKRRDGEPRHHRRQGGGGVALGKVDTRH